MSAFSSRSLGYKIGVVCLFLLTVMFLVGFSAPFWIENPNSNGYDSNLFLDVEYYSKVKNTTGLWMYCETRLDTGESQCHAFHGDIEAWLHGVRAVECGCLILLVAACVICLAFNCCRSQPGEHNRTLEVVAAIGGLLGLIGIIVYNVMENNAIGEQDISFSWAFYFTTVVCSVVVIVAVIISISNKAHHIVPPPASYASPSEFVLNAVGYPNQPGSVLVQGGRLSNNDSQQPVSGQTYPQYQSTGLQNGPPPEAGYSTVSGQNLPRFQGVYTVSRQNRPPPQVGYPVSEQNGPPSQAGYPVSRQNGPPPQVGYPVSEQNGPPSQAGYPVSRQNGPPFKVGYPVSWQSGLLLQDDYPVSGQMYPPRYEESVRSVESGTPLTNRAFESSPGDHERLEPTAPPL
ncbi:uncharacterized protein [Littorina saxatilis]|uniref:Uncharacterized protein n=1 Tax=Littorina saxatilis TaxID=31220 RepID=A0AAN9ANL5_9CAEN